MSRALRFASPRELIDARAGLEQLRAAREAFKDSPNTVARIRGAMKSAEGAIRHLERCVSHSIQQTFEGLL